MTGSARTRRVRAPLHVAGPGAGRPVGGQRWLLSPPIALRECRAGGRLRFLEQCAARSLDCRAGRLRGTCAWWAPSRPAGTGVLTGSHLDSVHDGGAYDGPLGVVSALAAIDLLRDRGGAPARPSGSPVFVEEEGSRFGRACLGSRLVTGATTSASARELTDRDGVCWGGDRRRGLDPRRGICRSTGSAASSSSTSSRAATWCTARCPWGWPAGSGPTGATASTSPGRPTMPGPPDGGPARPDAHLRDDGAGRQQAGPALRAAGHLGRISVHPNGTNAVPSLVTAWLDARASSAEHLDGMVGLSRGRPATGPAATARR